MSNHILPWWLSYAQHPHAMSKSNNHSVSDIVCFFFSSLSTISVCYVLEGLSVLRSRDTRSKPAHVQGHALLCVLSHCIRDWAYFGALCVWSRGGWVFVLVDCLSHCLSPLSVISQVYLIAHFLDLSWNVALFVICLSACWHIHGPTGKGSCNPQFVFQLLVWVIVSFVSSCLKLDVSVHWVNVFHEGLHVLAGLVWIVRPMCHSQIYTNGLVLLPEKESTMPCDL